MSNIGWDQQLVTNLVLRKLFLQPMPDPNTIDRHMTSNRRLLQAVCDRHCNQTSHNRSNRNLVRQLRPF